jgi:predicted CXXCH cytochrome family protein
MRKITIAIAVLAIALGSGAARAGIVGSKHDLSARTTSLFATGGQICLPCHAPHNNRTSATTAGYVWNRSLSTGITQYGASLTLTGNSRLCMSCHDGVTAMGEFNIVDSANITLSGEGAMKINGLADASHMTLNGVDTYVNKLGTDLSATHPVSVVYGNITGSDTSSWKAATAPTGSSTTWKVGSLRLENNGSGSGTFVGCSTCHTPHSTTYGKFLRMSNTGSALCLTCHVK